MSKIPLRYLPIAGILLLVCIIGYYLLKTGFEGVKKPVLDELLPDASLTIKNPHFSQDNPDNGTRFELEADEGIYSRHKQRISLNGFRLLLEPKDSPYMEIKGSKADWDTDLKIITLKGNLQGNSSDGYRLSTDNLTYDYKGKEDVLKTDEPVSITGPFFSVQSPGLAFYPGKGILKIPDAVTVFTLKKGI